MLNDMELEKRIARNSEVTLRISMTLPEYGELEELLTHPFFWVGVDW